MKPRLDPVFGQNSIELACSATARATDWHAAVPVVAGEFIWKATAVLLGSEA